MPDESNELEQARIVAAGWREQAHMLLDQIVAMNVAAAMEKREAADGE